LRLHLVGKNANPIISKLRLDGDQYKEVVEAYTLDGWLRLNGISLESKSVFLKLDTQGFDLEVIAGAAGALKDVRLIQIEVSCQPIYEGMPLLPQTLETLTHCGFELIDFSPISRWGDFGQIVEYDCFMVRP
jgi:hypothetical protein